MALLKVIEWSDNSHNTLVYKIDTKKNVIARGSALTVREGQAAVFCDKGRMADVFLPGYYKLDTDSLPVLTALLSWKYGFETPFKSEVYFVNTNRFTKQRWGTANPIMLRDPDPSPDRKRLLLHKHRSPGIPLLFRIIPVLVIPRKLQIDLSFLQLRLLQAERIGVRILKIF